MNPIFEKVPVAGSQSILVKTETFNRFDVPWHIHPEYEIFLIMKGNGEKIIGDSLSELEEGEIGLLGPNLPHLWRSNHSVNDEINESMHLIVQFHPHFAGDQFFALEEMHAMNNLLQSAATGLIFYGRTRQKAREMMLLLLSQNKTEQILTLLQLLHNLSISAERQTLSLNRIELLADEDAHRMNKVFLYLMENFQNQISLPEIAGIANLSPEAFCRYFNKRTKKTFTKFLNEVRIGHATKLLKKDTSSVSEIARLSGFNNLSNFNRQFRIITGFTPLKFKDLMHLQQLQTSSDLH